MVSSRFVAPRAGLAGLLSCLLLAGCAADGALLVAQDANVRERALQELEQTPPESRRKAIPALVAALGDKNPVVRRLAADSLAKVGPAGKDAVPALIAALRDDDYEVRYLAIEALGSLGPEAAPAVPALIAALKTTFGGVGLELGREGKNELTGVPIPGRPAERAGLARGDRIAAIDGRSTEGLSNAEAAELLRGPAGTRVAIKVRRTEGITARETEKEIVVERAEIPVAVVCRAAAEVLGGLGSAARAALPALRDASGETVDSIRLAAQAAVRRLER